MMISFSTFSTLTGTQLVEQTEAEIAGVHAEIEDREQAITNLLKETEEP